MKWIHHAQIICLVIGWGLVMIYPTEIYGYERVIISLLVFMVIGYKLMYLKAKGVEK